MIKIPLMKRLVSNNSTGVFVGDKINLFGDNLTKFGKNEVIFC